MDSVSEDRTKKAISTKRENLGAWLTSKYSTCTFMYHQPSNMRAYNFFYISDWKPVKLFGMHEVLWSFCWPLYSGLINSFCEHSFKLKSLKRQNSENMHTLRNSIMTDVFFLLKWVKIVWINPKWRHIMTNPNQCWYFQHFVYFVFPIGNSSNEFKIPG